MEQSSAEDQYEPRGVFETDYLTMCQRLGIKPLRIVVTKPSVYNVVNFAEIQRLRSRYGQVQQNADGEATGNGIPGVEITSALSNSSGNSNNKNNNNNSSSSSNITNVNNNNNSSNSNNTATNSVGGASPTSVPAVVAAVPPVASFSGGLTVTGAGASFAHRNSNANSNSSGDGTASGHTIPIPSIVTSIGPGLGVGGGTLSSVAPGGVTLASVNPPLSAFPMVSVSGIGGLAGLSNANGTTALPSGSTGDAYSPTGGINTRFGAGSKFKFSPFLSLEEDDEEFTKLSIRNWKLPRGTLDALSVAISASPMLSTLHLWNCDLDESDFMTLLSFVPFSNVRHLNLDMNPRIPCHLYALLLIPPAEALFAANATDGSNNVSSLNGGINANSIGVSSILGSNIDSINIQDRYYRWLKTLSLRYNKIGNKAVEAIGLALKFNRGLMTLNLWGNAIGDEGAIHLADALKLNRTLMSLSLGRNLITDEGAKAFARILAKCTLSNEELATKKKINELEKQRRDPEDDFAMRKLKARIGSTVGGQGNRPGTGSREKKEAESASLTKQDKRKNAGAAGNAGGGGNAANGGGANAGNSGGNNAGASSVASGGASGASSISGPNASGAAGAGSTAAGPPPTTAGNTKGGKKGDAPAVSGASGAAAANAAGAGNTGKSNQAGGGGGKADASAAGAAATNKKGGAGATGAAGAAAGNNNAAAGGAAAADKNKKAAGKGGKKKNEDTKEESEEVEEKSNQQEFMFEQNGTFYVIGNRILSSLNLAGNANITLDTVRAILEAVVEQDELAVTLGNGNVGAQNSAGVASAVPGGLVSAAGASTTNFVSIAVIGSDGSESKSQGVISGSGLLRICLQNNSVDLRSQEYITLMNHLNTRNPFYFNTALYPTASQIALEEQMAAAALTSAASANAANASLNGASPGAVGMPVIIAPVGSEGNERPGFELHVQEA